MHEVSRAPHSATGAPHVGDMQLPTDANVDRAFDALEAAGLRRIDYTGHIPDAPGGHLYGVEQGHATRAQVQRDLYNAHHADAAFGDGPDGAA